MDKRVYSAPPDRQGVCSRSSANHGRLGPVTALIRFRVGHIRHIELPRRVKDVQADRGLAMHASDDRGLLLGRVLAIFVAEVGVMDNASDGWFLVQFAFLSANCPYV